MKHFRKSLVCLLLVALLAAAALTGCAQNNSPSTTEASQTQAQTEAQTQAKTEAAPVQENQPQELGEGDKLFYFEIGFSDGQTSSYAIHTDAETVGEALVDLDLIAGEDSQYGLYVKTVGGETLDYDSDGMYWAFYENGEYAANGVDATPITEGASYAFTATKG